MTTRLTMRALLALLLCCGMLLSACGDDDDTDETTTASDPTVTTATGASSPAASATTESVAAEPTATVAEVEATSTTAVEATPTQAAPQPTEPDDTATRESTEPGTPDNSTTETPTDDDATTTPGAPATATIETGGDPVLAQQLADSFVGLSDLPEGWAFWDTGDDDNEDDNICGIPNLKDEFPPIARAEVSYQGSEAGPFISQSAAALSMTDAEAGMTVLEDAFANCDTWTDPDGVVYTLEALPFPELGDAAITRRVSAETGGFSLVIEVAYIRDRSFVLALAHYGVDEIDSTLTVKVAQTVLDRLAEVESPE